MIEQSTLLSLQDLCLNIMERSNIPIKSLPIDPPLRYLNRRPYVKIERIIESQIHGMTCEHNTDTYNEYCVMTIKCKKVKNDTIYILECEGYNICVCDCFDILRYGDSEYKYNLTTSILQDIVTDIRWTINYGDISIAIMDPLDDSVIEWVCKDTFIEFDGEKLGGKIGNILRDLPNKIIPVNTNEVKPYDLKI